MRNIILSYIVIAFLLAACNNNKGKTRTSETTGDSSSVETNTSEADMILQRMEQMKKLAPLNAEQVKALFPEELAGLKQSGYTPINSEGYEVGEGQYKSDNGKELDVTIFDCAGEAGAGKYNIMYGAYLNTESADDNGYKKSIRFNGDKAIESYEKKQDRYSLLFLSGDRLLVSVEGEKTGPEMVKQAANNLVLKTN